MGVGEPMNQRSTGRRDTPQLKVWLWHQFFLMVARSHEPSSTQLRTLYYRGLSKHYLPSWCSGLVEAAYAQIAQGTNDHTLSSSICSTP